MSKHSVKINSITCNATCETNITSGDEVFLVCQADGGLPIRVPAGMNNSEQMKKGSTWSLNDLVLNFAYEVLVTIWDHNLPYDPNQITYLQSHDFQPGAGSGNIRLTNLNGADYTISYTYID